MIIILTSHLWLPLLYSHYGNNNGLATSTDNEIFNILNTDINHCLSPVDGYCFLFDNEITLVNAILYDNQSMDDNITYNKKKETHMLSLIDKNGHFYNQYNILNNYSINKSIISYGDIITLLAKLGELEPQTSDSICICPSFINIIDNITFFFDQYENKWIIMYFPFIYRNNILSDNVLSTIIFDNKSIFYNKSKNINHAYNITNKFIHPYSFVVEYLSLVNNDDKILNNLSEMNIKITDFYSVNRTGIKKYNILYKTVLLDNIGALSHSKPIHNRKRIQFTGNDAICFIYCNTLNLNVNI